MSMLVTASELAGFMQQDLDTFTATQAITNASSRFESEADTRFAVSAHVYSTEGYGQQAISLPRQPVVAVTSVTVDGLATADYVLRGSTLYRLARWGGTSPYAALLVVTYTYGWAAPPDDVKEAVLFMAAQSYGNPSGVQRIQIDDYSETYAPNGSAPPADWRATARRYRVGAVA